LFAERGYRDRRRPNGGNTRQGLLLLASLPSLSNLVGQTRCVPDCECVLSKCVDRINYLQDISALEEIRWFEEVVVGAAVPPGRCDEEFTIGVHSR
jgi:hypothetical protein